MYRHWLLFRDLVNTCEDPNDMQIEVMVDLDIDYGEDTIILLEDARGGVLFNNIEDQLLAAFIFDQEAFLFDLCVPRNGNYLLSIGDRSSNGFVDGSVEIYVDRSLLLNVTGDFGRVVTVPIAAQDTAPPTIPQSPTKGPTRPPANPSTPAPTETDLSAVLGMLPSNPQKATQSPTTPLSPSNEPTARPPTTPASAPTEPPVVPVTMPVEEAGEAESSALTRDVSLGVAALCCAWLLF